MSTFANKFARTGCTVLALFNSICELPKYAKIKQITKYEEDCDY